MPIHNRTFADYEEEVDLPGGGTETVTYPNDLEVIEFEPDQSVGAWVVGTHYWRLLSHGDNYPGSYLWIGGGDWDGLDFDPESANWEAE